MRRGELITNLATLSPEEGLRVNYRRNSRENTSQDINILVRVIQTQKKTEPKPVWLETRTGKSNKTSVSQNYG